MGNKKSYSKYSEESFHENKNDLHYRKCVNRKAGTGLNLNVNAPFVSTFFWDCKLRFESSNSFFIVFYRLIESSSDVTALAYSMLLSNQLNPKKLIYTHI